MEVTELTIQIVLIGMPGILCYFVSSKLIGRVGRNTFEAVLSIILFSILSYLVLGLSIGLYNYTFGGYFPNDTVQKVFGNQRNVTATDVLGGALSSIVLAFFLSYLYRFNILNSVAQKIGATFRYGDEDLWHYFHNAREIDKNGGWVVVRDHKYKLVYYGYVSVWSESEAKRELILTDVDVFDNDTGNKLYSSHHIYLSRNAEDISIEVPNPPLTSTESVDAKPGKETSHRGS